MKVFDKYGWVIVAVSFLFMGAQIIRALIHWVMA